MENRVNIQAAQPKAYRAMFALDGYLAGTQLTDKQKDMIKLRASQINKCAFCINMHTEDAVKHGETLQRIFLLSAWNETNLFTEEEKAIMAITEEVTLIADHGLSNETYQKAAQLFDEPFIAQIIMAVATINAWNRIAISTNMGFEVKADASLKASKEQAATTGS